MHAFLLITAVVGAPFHYQYEGEIAPVKANTASPDVRFTLHFVVASQEADTIYWFLETANSSSKLPERFGVFDRAATEIGLPVIAYERPENRHIVAVGSPWLLWGKDFAASPRWKVGDQSVVAERFNKNQWRVTFESKYGRRKTAVLTDENSPIANYDQTLFFGQGVEHKLRWRLVSSAEFSDNSFQQVVAAIGELQEWKETAEGAVDPNPILQRAQKNASWKPLEQFLAAAVAETNNAAKKTNDVADLVKNTVGDELPDFELEQTSGGAIKREDLGGKVTVLHFWRYRPTPLRKPYGQVGYLDYLRRKLPSKKVALYGVAVDPRAAETSGRRAVIRDAKQMAEFMNLSYPILVDDGDFLAKIGDPRTVGVALPLFIVVNADGKIVHYHPGIYNAEANQGLKELEATVGDAMNE